MKVAGFDIGGANTDLAIVEYENGEIKDIQTVFEYLPMWSQNERLGYSFRFPVPRGMATAVFHQCLSGGSAS